jgi:hypothetical protein
MLLFFYERDGWRSGDATDDYQMRGAEGGWYHTSATPLVLAGGK